MYKPMVETPRPTVDSSSKKPRLLRSALLVLTLLVVALLAGSAGLSALAAPNAKVVVFSATWCANCREVVPALQRVAAARQVPVYVIDVDSQVAPKDAKSYGLNIPQKELPQAYLIDAGHSYLLFDGNQYKSGGAQNVESQLQSAITQRLGAP